MGSSPALEIGTERNGDGPQLNGAGSRQRPDIAALSGSQSKAPGFAGGYLLGNRLRIGYLQM